MEQFLFTGFKCVVDGNLRMLQIRWKMEHDVGGSILVRMVEGLVDLSS